MNRNAAFIKLPAAWDPLSRTTSVTITCAVILTLLCLSGCIQDSPPPSKERAVSLLLELLDDERPEMRRMAAESLGKIGDRGSIDSILPLVQDPDEAVRQASVTAMGRLKPTATNTIVALLAQALEDPVESVRQAAIVAIGEIEPGPRLLEPIVGLLRSSDAATRKAAVRALLQIDSSQSVSSLIAAGQDSDPDVRQGIVAIVGEWGGVAVSSWIRERLANDASPAVRTEAAYRLGMRSDVEAKAALDRAVVMDADSGVRNWAKRGGL
ncbi:MAG: HEAT repeat domain-containing protein [Nitrospirae bacterium]|nr:HEAT repeat domain-containing protein [Nitrospirota bacterium]